MQNKLSFHQSSASLEIIGLPDYSNNENKDQISIISQWVNFHWDIIDIWSLFSLLEWSGNPIISRLTEDWLNDNLFWIILKIV